jgi:hypothetical protein
MTYKLNKKSNGRNIRHSSITFNRSRSIIAKRTDSNQVLTVGKRIRFSNEEKLEICHRYFEGPKISQNDLCIWAKDKFLLDQVPAQSSISGILKGYDALELLTTNELQAFNLRKAQYPELESKLVTFITDMEKQNFAVNGLSLRLQAEAYCRRHIELLNGHEMPTFSDGWLDNLMRRNGLKCRIMNGEAGSVDMTSDHILTEIDRIRGVITKYPLKDIFNFDETGLFYRQAPQKTISLEEVSGSKVNKDRLTIGFMCSAEGEKVEPVIIGKAKQPQSFKKKSGKYKKRYSISINKTDCTNVYSRNVWL